MKSTGIVRPVDSLGRVVLPIELRRTLESAQKSLRRYLREVGEADRSDLDDVDPSILRQARQQIHQGAGALELGDGEVSGATGDQARALHQHALAQQRAHGLLGPRHVGPGAHLDVAVLEFAAIIEVAGLPQGLGGGTVDEHKLIAQAVRDDAEGGGGTDLAGADDNDFVAVHSDHGDVLA